MDIIGNRLKDKVVIVTGLALPETMSLLVLDRP
ncbi:MAG: hypothetical protein CM1200mP15_21110 [Dehalococcoidia bacterium]|nr:MAG: hypothetical protein CM1200mP15_21110 [Dehalococcoidia bacterium]